MPTFSKVYIDLSKTTDNHALRVFMSHLKNMINSLVLDSYHQMKIEQCEIGRPPIIRNSAKISSFNYSPSIDSDAFYANFAYFVHKDMTCGFPTKSFTHVKKDSIPYNQHRSLSVYYGHKDNYLMKYGIPEESNDLVIISLADDYVGQVIMKDLAHLIKAQYPEQIVLFQESCLKECDLETITVEKTTPE